MTGGKRKKKKRKTESGIAGKTHNFQLARKLFFEFLLEVLKLQWGKKGESCKV